MKKTYIGDGVYLDFDGYQFVMTTENGIEVTNTIYLEPEVAIALIECMKQKLGEIIHAKEILEGK